MLRIFLPLLSNGVSIAFPGGVSTYRSSYSRDNLKTILAFRAGRADFDFQDQDYYFSKTIATRLNAHVGAREDGRAGLSVVRFTRGAIYAHVYVVFYWPVNAKRFGKRQQETPSLYVHTNIYMLSHTIVYGG